MKENETLTDDIFSRNPGVAAWETVATLDSVLWRNISGVPVKPFHADAHMHIFTHAFGLPQEHGGAWLRDGAVTITLRASTISRARKEYYLKLTAMLSDWRRYAMPCLVKVNGCTVFAGNLFLPNVCRGWPSVYFRVPATALRRGRNAVEIVKSEKDTDQTLILHQAQLLAYDTGPAFSVVSAPALAARGQQFTVLVKTPDVARTKVILPVGIKLAGKPFRVFDEEDLWGFSFQAERPGLDEIIRFGLGKQVVTAHVALISGVCGEREPVLSGLQADDIRFDMTAEMRLVLKRLCFTDMGNLFVFRPSYGRTYYEAADDAEIGQWVRLLRDTDNRYMTCFHHFGIGAYSVDAMDAHLGAGFIGKMTHEVYLMVQRQWQTKRFQQARDVVEAAAAYQAYLKQRARPAGEIGSGEPSFLSVYAREARFKTIFCEPVGNFTLVTACARGACRGRETEMGYHLAPDWYFGWPNDEKKNRRTACSFFCGYIAGGKAFYLENAAFGTNANTRMDMEDDFCARNRQIMREFHVITRMHPRGGQLERRFAAVFGHCNSAIWLHDDVLPELRDTVHKGGSGAECGSNWTEPVWGKWEDNGSRKCMRVSDAVAPPVPFKTRNQSVLKMFTGTPYGQFDVIQADWDTLNEYGLVFYTGFNLMTDVYARRLAAFARQGGTVILAAAHLNASRLPKQKMAYNRSAAVARLTGVVWGASAVSDTVRRGRKTLAVKVLPVRRVTSATISAVTQSGKPLALENRLGKGKVVLLNGADYPSLEGLMNLYKSIVKRELDARGCEFGVSGTKKIFFGVYKEKALRMLQLYNCAWDEARAERFEVMLWGQAYAFSLKPCQFAEVVACPAGALYADSPYAKIEILRHGKRRLEIRYTSPIKTSVMFFENSESLASITGPDGKAIRHARGKFALPAAAGVEYVLTIGRAG